MDIPIIRINGIVPLSKSAIEQAIEAVPEHILFLQSTPNGNQKVIKLEDLKPGESVSYTDGNGKYYGKVTRPQNGDGFLMDVKL